VRVAGEPVCTWGVNFQCVNHTFCMKHVFFGSNFILLLQDSGPSHDLSAPRGTNSRFNLAARTCLNGPSLGAT
jgi:hypothetical protein